LARSSTQCYKIPNIEDAHMKIRPVLKGFLTFIPGMQRVLPKRGTGGTNSAHYSYELWLKHLTMLWENGMRSIPNTIAELGPGDSLGVGLAAMLSGVNNYYSLDVVGYLNNNFNLKIFEELVTLFKTRAGRPTKGWPDYDSYLDKKLFPSHILTDELLNTSLSEERIALIRNVLVNPGAQNKEVIIKYMVPWSDDRVIDKETVDLILSHSVLEHVVDLESTYQAFYLWLKPGGMMSHQIDFTSHGLSEKWNGYRAYSELLWKITVGRRPFLINRQPCSTHINLLKKNEFNVICHLKRYKPDGIQRSHLSSYWKNISDDDLTCSGSFVQAQKQ
jgi:hypothetical protein